MEESENQLHSSSDASCSNEVIDPRLKARSYQLELCKKAVDENTIVYLETGCGKTHIAVLLMYELGHLFRKPQKSFCVFLAPTVHLVHQQAKVIEDSTDFKVGIYSGGCKKLNTHSQWNKELQSYEVLVMTPQILIRNLQHCFMKMELIVLLIFDECHHAQGFKRHPYAQIMQEFYNTSLERRPRIFGMTASPVMGKGNSETLSKYMNSLEDLLDAKIHTVNNKEELERFVASPSIYIYSYDPVTDSNASSSSMKYHQKLDDIKIQIMSTARQATEDLKKRQQKMNVIRKLHDSLNFCHWNLGLWGTQYAIRTLRSNDRLENIKLIAGEADATDISFADQYLSHAFDALDFNLMDGGEECYKLDTLEEPFFSKKILLLIRILSSYRQQVDMKCIIFVKRIIIARSLALIIQNLSCLEFWKCEFLVGCHSGLKNMSRRTVNDIVGKFRSGKVNLLVATNVAEEGLDIQTCCLVIRFDLPETLSSHIQSRGRARMQQSEYIFLMERGNKQEENLLNKFLTNENCMNKEITSRSNEETFNFLEETIYKVDSSEASISTGRSVSLLHYYCSKLPRDEYFNPMPEFHYFNDLGGMVCQITLPSNAPCREISSCPCPTREEAKRDACLKACMKLHEVGALTDFLLPGYVEKPSSELLDRPPGFVTTEDENLGDLHQMIIPDALKEFRSNMDSPIWLNSYFIQFIPKPKDRRYRQFGLFLRAPLPKEAETMEVDLHLSSGRVVNTHLIPSGSIEFTQEKIVLAQNFQEMYLKIMLDRSEYVSDFIPLGVNNAEIKSSRFYLMLPVMECQTGQLLVDWDCISRCLSSPIFRSPKDQISSFHLAGEKKLKLYNGDLYLKDIVDSLVLTPHNNKFFFVVDVLHEMNGHSPFCNLEFPSYASYYKEKFHIHLMHPEQPLLKVKPLFSLHNLLQCRLLSATEARELREYFVELPAELCSLKIIGFSSDIGCSLSLLPSLMQKVETLLVAIELKAKLSISIPDARNIPAKRILEALTTSKCLEQYSLERLEVLGDAFLKYAVSRHIFLVHDAIDEGQLTNKRSAVVNNAHLYKLAIKQDIQMYICDEWFDPSKFLALGRSCMYVCNKETELRIHFSSEVENVVHGSKVRDIRCSKNHHWLQRKTVADVVEALVGAFIVDTGFQGALAFLSWIGIHVDYEISDVIKAHCASEMDMSISDVIDIDSLENILKYKFRSKGLLVQAFIHPSYNKHSGGCYQRLEFLGDAVLDYLITSYFYTAYPDLKPGQLTDLRSMAVNNVSFAHASVHLSFHTHLICDSPSLRLAIEEFIKFHQQSASSRILKEKPKCPKVLGDIVESCFGAVLLDTGFNLSQVWKMMLTLLDPIIFSSLELNPIRELLELCQSLNVEVTFTEPRKEKGYFVVTNEVVINNNRVIGQGTNLSGKDAKQIAAQQLLSKLKARGLKTKSKSLEEVKQACQKKMPDLLGFDEETINIDEYITFEPRNLAIKGTTMASSLSPCIVTTRKDHSNVQTNDSVCQSEKNKTVCNTDKDNITGVDYKGSAISFLHEICKSNHWNPPSFICCKDEGMDHLKLYTFKVTVQVEAITTTILECFSEPHKTKKSARQNAAAGALWYLKKQGYVNNL